MTTPSSSPGTARRARQDREREELSCRPSVQRGGLQSDGPGQQLPHNLQSLCRQLGGQQVQARSIAARPVKTCNETEPDRIVGANEDDGNCRGRGWKRRKKYRPSRIVKQMKGREASCLVFSCHCECSFNVSTAASSALEYS